MASPIGCRIPKRSFTLVSANDRSLLASNAFGSSSSKYSLVRVMATDRAAGDSAVVPLPSFSSASADVPATASSAESKPSISE